VRAAAPVDYSFYHLQRAPLDRALPRLLQRVADGGLRAVVMAGSRERIEHLNGVLWTFDAGSFLAHGAAGDGAPEEQPIFLTGNEENPNGATVLVLVDGADPAFKDTFDRCLDMFDGNDAAAVSAARARWTAAKDAGHTVTYWKQTETGGWQEAG
jgi:DNA polymerase-3 subunit chi